MQKNNSYRIILASASPRRSELLKQIGLEFQISVSDADEHMDGNPTPEELVKELSRRKARAVLEELLEKGELQGNDNFCIIGADTVVALEGKILGKPGNAERSREMLQELSGKAHQVFTGVTLIAGTRKENDLRSFAEKTEVRFDDMSEAEIASYIATGEPFDKAGAYGIQGYCARYITGITGDYSNVVGLPLSALYRNLKEMQVL